MFSDCPQCNGDLNQSGHVDSEFVNLTEKSRCTLTMTTTKTSTAGMDTLETRTWTGGLYKEKSGSLTIHLGQAGLCCARACQEVSTVLPGYDQGT